jgi:hypothetical protein
MKHAGKAALAQLGSLLAALGNHGALVERTPGSFYLRSAAFLHLHEDPSGLFADLKEDLVSFGRFRVTTAAEQKSFFNRVVRCLEKRERERS